MAIIIDIYKQELNDASPHLVYGSRSGGDEFRFVVSGIGQEKLNAAIERAQNRIEKFVEEIGLDQLEHSKHPNNPIKCGMGAEIATKRLPVDFPSYDLENELDKTINEKKLHSGKRKTEKKQITIETPENITASMGRIEKMNGVINNYKDQKKHTILPDKKFPFQDVKLEKEPVSIFDMRKQQLSDKSKQLNMNSKQTTFLSDILTGIYDAPDEKTGMKRNRDFIDSVKRVQDLSKCDNKPCFLLKMDAYNFSSLNEILSHYGNDVMFKQLADIATKHLKDFGAICFHRGGGIIAPIIIDKNSDEVNKALDAIIEEFHQTIGNKSIKEYCAENKISYSQDALQKLGITEDETIKNIPSIRGFKPGSGFIISKTDLRKSADINGALTQLDHSNELNRSEGIVFKRRDSVTYLDGKKAYSIDAERQKRAKGQQRYRRFGLQTSATTNKPEEEQKAFAHPAAANDLIFQEVVQVAPKIRR